MRVLVVHNRYRSSAPSGENQLVDAEIKLLRGGGVDVVTQIEDSDAIPAGPRGVLEAAPGPVYARHGVRRFARLLRETTPALVHLHNVFPLVSPWVIKIAGEHGIPVVQTVHNYRHGCINGLHLRDDRVCTDCVGTRLGLPGVRHGCYRDSRLQSVPMTIGQVVHRRTWHRGVTRFLALTPFMRDQLVSYGIPADKIVIRPTWVPDPGVASPPGRDVLYVGRLDAAKGIDRLLDAWAAGGRDSGRRLVIVGDGPMHDLVQQTVDRDPSVHWTGQLASEGVAAAMAEAALVVVPSRVFEGYPLVVAEAFGRGRPVLAFAGGSVGSVIGESGWVVEPSTPLLAEAIKGISGDDARDRGAVARTYYLAHNSPERGLDSLLDVYRATIVGT